MARPTCRSSSSTPIYTPITPPRARARPAIPRWTHRCVPPSTRSIPASTISSIRAWRCSPMRKRHQQRTGFLHHRDLLHGVDLAGRYQRAGPAAGAQTTITAAVVAGATAANTATSRGYRIAASPRRHLLHHLRPQQGQNLRRHRADLRLYMSLSGPSARWACPPARRCRSRTASTSRPSKAARCSTPRPAGPRCFSRWLPWPLRAYRRRQHHPKPGADRHPDAPP